MTPDPSATLAAFSLDASAGLAFAAIAVSALSLLVAGFSAWYARRANELVNVYKRAMWHIRGASAERPGVTVTNKGGSAARKVYVTLDSDPVGRLVPFDRPVEMLSEGESATFQVMISTSHRDFDERTALGFEWEAQFRTEEQRAGKVHWMDADGHRWQQVIRFSATPDGEGLVLSTRPRRERRSR